jgi:hypothetical protein
VTDWMAVMKCATCLPIEEESRLLIEDSRSSFEYASHSPFVSLSAYRENVKLRIAELREKRSSERSRLIDDLDDPSDSETCVSQSGGVDHCKLVNDADEVSGYSELDGDVVDDEFAIVVESM